MKRSIQWWRIQQHSTPSIWSSRTRVFLLCCLGHFDLCVESLFNHSFSSQTLTLSPVLVTRVTRVCRVHPSSKSFFKSRLRQQNIASIQAVVGIRRWGYIVGFPLPQDNVYKRLTKPSFRTRTSRSLTFVDSDCLSFTFIEFFIWMWTTSITNVPIWTSLKSVSHVSQTLLI